MEFINVIIDARMVTKEMHGIARYTYEVIKNISLTNKVKYYLLVNDIEESKSIFEDINNIEFIKMNSKFLSLSEQIELPKIINSMKEDVIFHSPSFVSSPFIKKKMIMTIHDLNHLKFPQFYTKFHKYYYEYIVKKCANMSQRIITVSEFSKEELISWLKCKRDKVIVTYNGIEDKFNKITNESKVNHIRKKYNLEDTFLLYIGNQKAHKNTETLIKAMQYVEDKNIKLVMNGKPSKENEKLIELLNLEDKVRFIGFIEDDDLPTIYSLSEAFIFPSLYEGFGLPPLEAMACEVPTIVSNAAALPEVVGDGAIIFNVKDYEDLSQKINEILSDENKSKLINSGLNRSKEFTWHECSEKTLHIYENVDRSN